MITLSVNNGLLGYTHLAFLGINVKSGFTDQVIEALSAVDEVLEIHEMYGKFDLFLKVRAKDLVHIRDIIEKKIGILPHMMDRINEYIENKKRRTKVRTI